MVTFFVLKISFSVAALEVDAAVPPVVAVGADCTGCVISEETAVGLYIVTVMFGFDCRDDVGVTPLVVTVEGTPVSIVVEKRVVLVSFPRSSLGVNGETDSFGCLVSVDAEAVNGGASEGDDIIVTPGLVVGHKVELGFRVPVIHDKIAC